MTGESESRAAYGFGDPNVLPTIPPRIPDGTGPKALPSEPSLLVNNQSRASAAEAAMRHAGLVVKIFIGDPIDLNLLLRGP